MSSNMFTFASLMYGFSFVFGLSLSNGSPIADPCPVKDGCVKLPSSSQILNLQKFETEMLGRLYSIPYYTKGPRLQDTYFRMELGFIREDDGNVYEHYKFRSKGSQDCNIFTDVNLKQPLNNLTIFDLNQYIGLESWRQHFRWYYVTDDPTKYALVMICIDRKTLTDTV